MRYLLGRKPLISISSSPAITNIRCHTPTLQHQNHNPAVAPLFRTSATLSRSVTPERPADRQLDEIGYYSAQGLAVLAALALRRPSGCVQFFVRRPPPPAAPIASGFATAELYRNLGRDLSPRTCSAEPGAVARPGLMRSH